MPTTTANNPDLTLPTTDARPAAIAATINAFLDKHDLAHTGGCRAYYTPAEWRDRGEEYGLKSILVIVHDGGDLSHVLNGYTAESGAIYAELLALVEREHGVYFESCTCWYTAVYPVYKAEG